MTRKQELQVIINEAQIELAQIQQDEEVNLEAEYESEAKKKLIPLGFEVDGTDAEKPHKGFCEFVSLYVGKWGWYVTEDETDNELVDKEFMTLDDLLAYRDSNMPKSTTYRVTYEVNSFTPNESEIREIIEGNYSTYFGQEPTIEVID